MPTHSIGIALAVTVAVVVVIVAGAAGIYSLAQPSSSQGATLAITTATTGPPNQNETTTYVGSPPFAPSGNLDKFQVANTALTSPEVQSYIKNAYSYDLASMDSRILNLFSVVLNVTESQSVTGNWSTGYTVSYSGIRTLNATVQFTEPDTYKVVDFVVTSYANQSQSVTFSSQQMQAIQVALSNSTVNSLTYQSSYYVESVTQFPMTNVTFGGDYLVLLYQLNGTRIVGAFVNASLTAVQGVYTDTRATTTCIGSPNTCFTSPWGGS